MHFFRHPVRFLRLGCSLVAMAFLMLAAIVPSIAASAEDEALVTVTFILGPHGARTGGGGLLQKIPTGGDADEPVVSAVEGWVFAGWDTDTSEFYYVESDLKVTARFLPAVTPRLVGRWLPTAPWAGYDVATAGDLLAMANGTGGLALIDVQDPFHPVQIGQATGIDAFAVAVHENHAAVLGADGGLHLYDISIPAKPVRTGGVLLSGTIDVALQGRHAYVISDAQGLQIIDITNSASPVIVGAYPNLSGEFQARDIQVVGTHAYVANGAAGLEIIEVSNPAAPVLAGRCATGADALKLTVLDSHAYVSTEAYGQVAVIDISDPARPTLVSTYATAQNAYYLTASGHYLYLTDRYSGLEVIDISNPASPMHVTRLHDENRLFDGPMLVSGHLLHVGNGLHIVDLTHPASPELVTHIDSFEVSLEHIKISGNQAFVTETWSGLNIFDLTDPGRPGKLTTGPNPYSGDKISATGAHACVVTQGTGLEIVDASDPARPVRTGLYPLPGAEIPDFEVKGSLVCLTVLTDTNGNSRTDRLALHLVDISNPEAPVLLAIYDDFPANRSYLPRLALDGDRAYLVPGDQGRSAEQKLYIIDIANPALPSLRHVQSLGFPRIFDLTVDGTLIYMLGGFSGFNIFDMADLENISSVGYLSGSFTFRGEGKLEHRGDFIFVTDRHKLGVIDVSNPGNPVLVGELEGDFSDFDVRDHTLYAINTTENSVHIIDLPLPGYRPQAILFNPPSRMSFGAPPFALSATADSRLPVTFSVVSGPAYLAEDGRTLHLAAAGTVILRAEQTGDGSHLAAPPIERTLIVAKALQTILFAPPARITLDARPLLLSATASSGLPVELTVLSGPATLDGSLLTSTAPGTTLIRATQAGDANTLPAQMEKIITITSPQLVLGGLRQTYDGTPRIVAVSGVPDGFHALVIYDGSPTPPTNAGTYTIVASFGDIRQTGILVVAKKDLVVSGVSTSRVIGADNPPLALAFEGFADGDTAADLVQPPRLTTKAQKSSPEGLYRIIPVGGLDLNYRYVFDSSGTLGVLGFSGSYEALLGALLSEDDTYPGTYVGKLVVTLSPKNLAYTGVLTLASEPRPLAIRGILIAAGSASATGTWSRALPDTDSLDLTFRLSVSDSDTIIEGALVRNGDPGERIVLSDGNRVRAETPDGPTTHTVVFQSGWNVGPENPLRKLGHGHASARLHKTNGTMELRGILADGAPLTASIRLCGDNHLLWANPYQYRTNSYLVGALERNATEGFLFWEKAPLPDTTPEKKRDRVLREGLHTGIDLLIDPWLPPSPRSSPPVTLAERIGKVYDNTETGDLLLDHEIDHIDVGQSSSLLPAEATLTPGGLLTARDAASTAWKITRLDPATGAFTGSFILSDLVPAPTAANPQATRKVTRTVTFSGTLRQIDTLKDYLIGAGFFLVPPLPGTDSTEQSSGSIQLY